MLQNTYACTTDMDVLDRHISQTSIQNYSSFCITDLTTHSPLSSLYIVRLLAAVCVFIFFPTCLSLAFLTVIWCATADLTVIGLVKLDSDESRDNLCFILSSILPVFQNALEWIIFSFCNHANGLGRCTFAPCHSTTWTTIVWAVKPSLSSSFDETFSLQGFVIGTAV